MEGRVQCYMYLMYLGNIDVVSAQVHSYYVSSACRQLPSIELFHDRATLFLVSQRLMSPHLTCLVLYISWAGSCVPMLHSIGHDNGLVSWLLNCDL